MQISSKNIEVQGFFFLPLRGRKGPSSFCHVKFVHKYLPLDGLEVTPNF
jgi:hypothetical protein